MNNKYIYRSKISEKKFREILRYFCFDLEAKKVADLTNISRPTINKIYHQIREKIALECEKECPFENGEIELDESYFGSKRVRGKRGRGASGKTPVFGMLKRNGKVYTQVVKNCSVAQILPIIKGNISHDATIYTDGFKTYDGLVNFGYKKHYRIKHGENEFAKGRNHINGIENFWGLAKVRLTKFRGIQKKCLSLHIKECEFRFNNRDKNIYKLLLKIIRENPLNLS